MMKDKFIIFIILIFITKFLSPVSADSSQFGHPLRIEPAGIYNKLRLDGTYTQRRTDKTFEKDKSASVEGEIIFLDNFSLKVNGGATRYESVGEKTISQNDRWNTTLKFASESGGSNLRFVWGGGVRLYDKQKTQNPRYEINPDLYIVRPNLSFGVGVGIFEFQADLSMQSETNSKFREVNNQDFRRSYQAGGLVSVSLGNLRLLAETEYRVPYDKKIDTLSRYWNFYPGISYKIFDQTMISLSGQIPVNGESSELGKGFRFSLFQFF